MPTTGFRYGGVRFDDDKSRWLHASSEAPSDVLGRPLRLATLNCLHDHRDAELLQHDRRYDAILKELETLDADVICLNEVTRTLLERVLREPWVRRSYTASAIRPEGSFGNLLLSKVPPFQIEFIEQPGDGRHSHVAVLMVNGLAVAVCSTHLTAFPYLMETRRMTQLAHLTSTLATGGFDVACVMGDFNFHREAETSSIPEGWAELPAVVSLGPTWDLPRNAMLPHYLPLRNLYTGLGSASASAGRARCGSTACWCTGLARSAIRGRRGSLRISRSTSAREGSRRCRRRGAS